MGQYQPRYSAVSFCQEYKEFFSNFYKISDTPDAHDLYSQQFTSDATLIMASKKAEGTSGEIASVHLSSNLGFFL